MNLHELEYDHLVSTILQPYLQRANTDSARFMRWYLENIWRLDPQNADDACVDGQQDKGIDAIYVSDFDEVVFLFQSKVRQKAGAELGDVDLKNFFGSVEQFRTVEGVDAIMAGDAKEALKRAIDRSEAASKIASGYDVVGYFCTNQVANADAIAYLDIVNGLVLADATSIVNSFIEIDKTAGVTGEFLFDAPEFEVINYSTGEAQTCILLAGALNLLHMEGIDDQSLFEKNVRKSLGNTKVNKSLSTSISTAEEHRNFPLYHNGVTVLCEELFDGSDGKIGIRNYSVVNGAQSITSLSRNRSRITEDLRILVKIVALGMSDALADKITTNSNNQNAIKARDMRANSATQTRLQREVAEIDYKEYILNIKQGEFGSGPEVINNELAGLAMLAIDLGEPWACHQRFKVMDESHGKIFARPEVTGGRLIGCWELMRSVEPAVDGFDDAAVGGYNLTKYFLAHTVAEIFRSTDAGRQAFNSFHTDLNHASSLRLLEVFSSTAVTTAFDFNAYVVDSQKADSGFDHKRDLKSPSWCRAAVASLVADFNKDVARQKVSSIEDQLSI